MPGKNPRRSKSEKGGLVRQKNDDASQQSERKSLLPTVDALSISRLNIKPIVNRDIVDLGGNESIEVKSQEEIASRTAPAQSSRHSQKGKATVSRNDDVVALANDATVSAPTETSGLSSSRAKAASRNRGQAQTRIPSTSQNLSSRRRPTGHKKISRGVVQFTLPQDQSFKMPPPNAPPLPTSVPENLDLDTAARWVEEIVDSEVTESVARALALPSTRRFELYEAQRNRGAERYTAQRNVPQTDVTMEGLQPRDTTGIHTPGPNRPEVRGPTYSFFMGASASDDQQQHGSGKTLDLDPPDRPLTYDTIKTYLENESLPTEPHLWDPQKCFKVPHSTREVWEEAMLKRQLGKDKVERWERAVEYWLRFGPQYRNPHGTGPMSQYLEPKRKLSRNHPTVESMERMDAEILFGLKPLDLPGSGSGKMLEDFVLGEDEDEPKPDKMDFEMEVESEVKKGKRAVGAGVPGSQYELPYEATEDSPEGEATKHHLSDEVLGWFDEVDDSVNPEDMDLL